MGDAAFQQCRAHQNAAYLQCATMYKHGMGEFAPTGSGSGSGMAMVASPMQFQEATIVRTTAKPRDDMDDTEKSLQEFNDLLHPHGETPRKQRKSVSQTSTEAVNTVDNLFKAMGDDGDTYTNDGIDDALGGDMGLLQEADEALKEMGFPPLP